MARMLAEWARLRKGWGNGERPLIIAILVFLAASLFFIAMVLVSVVFAPVTYAPLENITPQKVLNTGPIYPGGVVSVVAVKCNHADQDVATSGNAYYRNLDTGQLTLFFSGEGSRPPGCTTYHYANPVPSSLPSGRYRIEGIDIARQGTQIQQEPVRTEPFTVVAS